jgi:hypothetical protein
MITTSVLLLLLLQAEATAVFPDRQLVEARSVDGVRFYIGYNKLAICTGSQVREHNKILFPGCVWLLSAWFDAHP